jgi:hypothetical protein
MGTLTSDMTRLCGEIVSMRNARGKLMKEMAHGARNLGHSVHSMLADLSKDRMHMARKAGAERAMFVSGLHKAAARMKKEVLSDLAGARRAWQGSITLAAAGHHEHIPLVSETKHEAATHHVSPDAIREKDRHIKAGSKKKKHKH